MRNHNLNLDRTQDLSSGQNNFRSAERILNLLTNHLERRRDRNESEINSSTRNSLLNLTQTNSQGINSLRGSNNLFDRALGIRAINNIIPTFHIRNIEIEDDNEEELDTQHEFMSSEEEHMPVISNIIISYL